MKTRMIICDFCATEYESEDSSLDYHDGWTVCDCEGATKERTLYWQEIAGEMDHG